VLVVVAVFVVDDGETVLVDEAEELEDVDEEDPEDAAWDL
jgi:hypothetical protein